MKTLSGKEFCKLLEVKGWILARVNGSHHIYSKSGSVIRISVPVHANKSLKIGLQKAIMKSAGIKESEL
jgi:predicted RNA binding protein YcfA (HicA-like mRNA interferase family)